MGHVWLCGACMVGMQAGDDAGKAKGADKAVRKEAGRLTKLQEELERLEARWSDSALIQYCIFSSHVVDDS